MLNITFTIFFLIYATELNSVFLSELLQKMKGGFNAGIGLVTFVVAIMGLATTVVSSLTVMQLFKKTGNIPQN